MVGGSVQNCAGEGHVGVGDRPGHHTFLFLIIKCAGIGSLLVGEPWAVGLVRVFPPLLNVMPTAHAHHVTITVGRMVMATAAVNIFLRDFFYSP